MNKDEYIETSMSFDELIDAANFAEDRAGLLLTARILTSAAFPAYWISEFIDGEYNTFKILLQVIVSPITAIGIIGAMIFFIGYCLSLKVFYRHLNTSYKRRVVIEGDRKEMVELAKKSNGILVSPATDEHHYIYFKEEKYYTWYNMNN